MLRATSTAFAMICLVQLYRISKPFLAEFRTGMKFASIKIVIGLSMFQQLALSALVASHIIEADQIFDAETKSAAWQNFLLTIEIFFISLLFLKSFTTNDYQLIKISPIEENANENYVNL